MMYLVSIHIEGAGTYAKAFASLEKAANFAMHATAKHKLSTARIETLSL
jgi:hypothetical protein